MVGTTVTISKEEYKHFLRCEMQVDFLTEHAINSSFISERLVKQILGIKEEDNATN